MGRDGHRFVRHRSRTGACRPWRTACHGFGAFSFDLLHQVFAGGVIGHAEFLPPIGQRQIDLGHIGAQALDNGLAFRQGSTDFDRLNRMLAWLNTTFFNAFGALWYVYEHDTEAAEKAVLQAYGRGKVLKAHRQLEALLEHSEGPWLLGARRTLADAYFSGIARWADYHAVFERDAFPRIAALRARLADDAGVEFAHAIEKELPLPVSLAFEGHVSLDDALASARDLAFPARAL